MKILWFSRHTFQSPHGGNCDTGYGLPVLLIAFPSPHEDKFNDFYGTVLYADVVSVPLQG